MSSYSAPDNADIVISFHASEFAITASKALTTVTKTAGRNFIPSDVGLTIFWGAPNSTTDTITAYISPTQVTVAASATIASQAATVTGIPASMGFKLARGKDGQLSFSAKDLAPAEVVARVQSQGFEINPETLEITFYKDRWGGPVGAYEERPGQGRPAFSQDIDHKNPNPCLGPKAYVMGGKARTASTISFSTTTPGTIQDSANGFAEFKTGDRITITGSASNNGTYTISTGAVAGTIRTTQATTAEVAGASVTITVTMGNSPVDVVSFGGATYVAYGNRLIYKATNWGTPGSSYLVQAFQHSNGSCVFTDLHVHNGYILAGAGTSAVYAYSSDGTTWTESNRGGTDQQATEFVTLNGILHKRVGANNHHQLSAQTDTAINGGTAWSSADQIGDTSSSIGRMLAINNSLAFAMSNGVVTLDANGNLAEVFPELQQIGTGNSSAALVWQNNSFVYPSADGGVYYYKEGAASAIMPVSQVERTLEITQMTQPPITEDISAIARMGDYVYALQVDASSNEQILLLQDVNGVGPIWRTFLRSVGGDTTINKLWATYVTDAGGAGPVLWTDTSDADQRLKYFILPRGKDATQDTRCKFGATGTIYDPWLTMGCPEIQKRWSHIEAACTQSTPANYAKTTYTIDAYNEAGTDKVTTNTFTMAQGITINTVNFDANTISRRSRLVHALGNTGASQEAETPILLWIRVHAFALPTPRHQFSMALQVPIVDGPDTQAQKRRFLKYTRTAQLPMTLQDRFGATWTVNRAVEQPSENYVRDQGIRTEEVYALTLVEQPVGV